MNNKVITTQGNVQFQFPDGKIVNVHPNYIYTVFNEDTVSFILVGLPKSSGLSTMTSKAEDLELNGTVYSFAELPNAVSEAFAEAGAQARCEIVDELPESGYTNTIYLVPQEEGEGYDEYIWLKDEERWELIGDTDIEMKNYLKKVDFNAYSAATKVIIDDEISARTQGDITLDAKIDQEIADRASDVDDEEARAISAETALQTAIDNEISARTDAVSTEQAAREAADSFISGAVDTVSSGLTQEVQRAQNAESGLSEDIDAEEARALAAEEALSGAVDTVTSNLNAFVSDFNTYSGEVSSELAEKALQSDLTTLSGTVAAHIDDSSIHLTSGDVQTQIENAIADKLDTTDFEAYSGETDARIAENEEVTAAALVSLNDRVNEDEEVTAAGLNSLNEALSEKADVNDVYTKSEIDDALVAKVNTSDFETYSGTVETALSGKQDTLIAGENITISGNVISSEGGGSSYTAGDGIDITNDVISVSGVSHNSLEDGTKMLLRGNVTSSNQNYTNIGFEYYYGTSTNKNEINLKPLTINGKSALRTQETSISVIDTSAITTSISSASTDAQVPSAKAVYDAIQEGGGGSITVDSALDSGSTNPVENQALWDELRLGGAGLVETTIEWSGDDSVNYPSGSTEIKLEFTDTGSTNISFYNENSGKLGEVSVTYFPQWSMVEVNNSDFEGSSYEISGSTITISYPSVTNVAKLNSSTIHNFATVKAIYNAPLIVLKDQVTANTAAIETKVDTTTFNSYASSVDSALDGKLNISDYVVDSALNVASLNPIQNQALYSELRLSDGGEAETTLAFENNYSTNYPNGCTKIKVEVVGSNNISSISFNDNDNLSLGTVNVNNFGSISVDTSYFQGTTYEISGTTVIISYPTVTNVTKIQLSGNGDYVYKAVTTSTTPLKDQVVANTTALGGLSLVQLTQAEYSAMEQAGTLDNSTLYIVIDS